MRKTLHLDIRTRIIALIVFNLICAVSDPLVLGFNSILFFLCFIYLKLPVTEWIRQLRLFFVLLLVIAISRSISVPGRELYGIGPVSITAEGLKSALFFSWKLTLVVIIGVIFIQTSQTFEIKSGIQWFLAPVPLINEKQVAILLSLMLRFLPSIIQEANEIEQAQISRGINKRINPYYRMVCFVGPLFRKTFNSVNELSDAMESRNYCDDRSELQFTFSRVDAFTLFVLFSYSAVVILFPLY